MFPGPAASGVTRPYRLRHLLLVLLAVTAVLVGCSSGSTTNTAGPTTAPSSVTPTTGATGSTAPATTLPPFNPEPVAWKACDPKPVGFDCGTVEVPLNYEKPTGQKIKLGVIRKAASDPTRRIGSLLMNPGGPGAPGTKILPAITNYFSDDVRARFDLVSWDPRGIGLSVPLTCDRGALDFYSTDQSNTHPPADVDEAAKKWAALCQRENGGILPFLGTQDVARDLESLRQAVGDDKLNYAGFSYGTVIGLVYAENYPTHIRAMILDGVVDPTIDFTENLVQQSTAVEDAYDRFIAWCKDHPGTDAESCPIAPDPQAVIDKVFDQARTDPLPGKIGNEVIYLSTTFVSFALTSATYDSNEWPSTAAALKAASELDWNPLAKRANGYWSEVSQPANAAVNCLDAVSPTGDKYQALVDAAAQTAPHLGVYNANTSRICKFWPTPPKPLPTSYRAAGSPTIMVWGTTGDNATPYTNAVKISGMLENARLVTLEADRHSAAGANDCVTRIQGEYVVSLTLPPPDTKC